MQQMPTQQTPMQQMPMRQMPTQQMPTQQMPMQHMPMQDMQRDMSGAEDQWNESDMYQDDMSDTEEENDGQWMSETDEQWGRPA